jgi:hypothetical protein
MQCCKCDYKPEPEESIEAVLDFIGNIKFWYCPNCSAFNAAEPYSLPDGGINWPTADE